MQLISEEIFRIWLSPFLYKKKNDINDYNQLNFRIRTEDICNYLDEEGLSLYEPYSTNINIQHNNPPNIRELVSEIYNQLSTHMHLDEGKSFIFGDDLLKKGFKLYLQEKIVLIPQELTIEQQNIFKSLKNCLEKKYNITGIKLKILSKLIIN